MTKRLVAAICRGSNFSLIRTCNTQSPLRSTRWSQCSIREQHSHTFLDDSRLPRIAQSSLWETIFPKTLRQRSRDFFRTSQKKEINPASYFIWIYLLIGSQAIRILSIQNETKTYMRKADLQIAKLREVVGKLQRGEPVDVEKVLGTGDEAQELEWEEAIKEIENEDRIWQEGKRKREADQKRLDSERQKMEAHRQDASPVNEVDEVVQRPPLVPGFY